MYGLLAPYSSVTLLTFGTLYSSLLVSDRHAHPYTPHAQILSSTNAYTIPHIPLHTQTLTLPHTKTHSHTHTSICNIQGVCLQSGSYLLVALASCSSGCNVGTQSCNFLENLYDCLRLFLISRVVVLLLEQGFTCPLQDNQPPVSAFKNALFISFWGRAGSRVSANRKLAIACNL